jgi:hypothetical protein
MIYRYERQAGGASLSPLPFKGLGLEKDLENLLADHLLDTLFEQSPLMPLFQERKGQAVGDIYALDAAGDLHVFELKRGEAGGDAVHQALLYVQKAGMWPYEELERRYHQGGRVETDEEGSALSLALAHQKSFGLNEPLLPAEFNRRQHIIIIGSASDDAMVEAVDYWRRQGLSINFVPYRIYEVGGEMLFEMFSLPYDRHRNPGDRKGVLFDTNARYSSEDVWDMMERSRVAAYGGAAYFADHVSVGDTVFYSHRGVGVIAAARVVGETKDGRETERYHDVEFLTPVPTREEGIKRALPFHEVSRVTGKTFFWARTIKVPYLTHKETTELLNVLRDRLVQD